MKPIRLCRNISFFLIFSLIPILIIRYKEDAFSLSKFLAFNIENIFRLIFLGLFIIFIICFIFSEEKKDTKVSYKKIFIIADLVILVLFLILLLLTYFVFKPSDMELSIFLRDNYWYHYLLSSLLGLIMGTFFYWIIVKK